MIIDAHHHVWDPGSRAHDWLADLPALRRRFGLDDFAEVSAPEGISASVLVQVLADTSETEEFLALADGGTVVAAVVGWADLAGPDVATELARLRGVAGGRGGGGGGPAAAGGRVRRPLARPCGPFRPASPPRSG